MPVLSKDRDLMPEKSSRGKSITRTVFIRGEVDSRVKAVIFMPSVRETGMLSQILLKKYIRFFRNKNLFCCFVFSCKGFHGFSVSYFLLLDVKCIYIKYGI